jgi:hypothetical protein
MRCWVDRAADHGTTSTLAACERSSCFGVSDGDDQRFPRVDRNLRPGRVPGGSICAMAVPSVTVIVSPLLMGLVMLMAMATAGLFRLPRSRHP